jgi:hypothetical protein
MSRQIVSTADVLSSTIASERSNSTVPSASSADTYGDRVLKYIPAELVALYLAVSHMIKSAATEQNRHLTLWWIIIAALLVATPVYLQRLGRVGSRAQIAVSTAAFAIWVFALDSPIDYIVPDHASLDLYKAVVLPLFTFLVGLLVPQGDSLKLADATSRARTRKLKSAKTG